LFHAERADRNRPLKTSYLRFAEALVIGASPARVICSRNNRTGTLLRRLPALGRCAQPGMQLGNRAIVRVLAQMGFENAQYDMPHFRFGGAERVFDDAPADDDAEMGTISPILIGLSPFDPPNLLFQSRDSLLQRGFLLLVRFVHMRLAVRICLHPDNAYIHRRQGGTGRSLRRRQEKFKAHLYVGLAQYQQARHPARPDPAWQYFPT
jgi:hypothetical protein